MGLVVAKVGGSLFDLPDLRERLTAWGSSQTEPLLFVAGGGECADVIRRMDRVHGLGEEDAHWLALRMLTVNAQLLARLLSCEIVRDLPDAEHVRLSVLDPHEFCLKDECRSGSLPHVWLVTSDSIAARVAEVAGARLVLLKSTDLLAGTNWVDAGTAGLVDEVFGSLVARSGLNVVWINLRQLVAERDG